MGLEVVSKKQNQGMKNMPALPMEEISNCIKILIVEDSKADMELFVRMLSADQFKILKAKNGSEAITQFKKEEPDIILMDLYMPVMDGHEATRIIKTISNEKNLYVPIIILTAMNDESALVESLECGGDDFLVKPVSPAILKAKIAVMIRNKEMHDLVNRQKKKLEQAQNLYLQDMEIAEKIIRNISRSKYLDNGNIKYMVAPVDILSGDLILCAVTPSKSQIFLVADFTGHGLGAAIGSMIVADAFYAMVFKGYTLTDIVYELNHKLNITLPTGRFMAVCLIEMHTEQQTISVLNAGLPDVMVISENAEIRLKIPSQNLPLGVVRNEEQDLKIEHYQVEKGDKIYIYSDGLIEAQNIDDEYFSMDRLEKCICNVQDMDNTFECILETVKNFRGEAKQLDDISLLEISCRNPFIEDPRYWLEKHKHRPPMGWEFSIKLNADLIKELNPLPMIVQLLTDIQGINAYRPVIHTIISELYLNSLEHGILGLDKSIRQSENGFTEYYLQREKGLADLEQGSIEIHIKHKPLADGGMFNLRIIDSGAGFDFKKLLSDKLQGRGISLVKSLSDSIEYQQDGNVVEVEFGWNI